MKPDVMSKLETARRFPRHSSFSGEASFLLSFFFFSLSLFSRFVSFFFPSLSCHVSLPPSSRTPLFLFFFLLFPRFSPPLSSPGVSV